MQFRNYRETDYDAVCDFLIALNRDDRRHINWNWARFEWMYEHPEFDRAEKDAFGLWLEGGRVVGAAIYDMYFGEAFCGVLPGYGDLYPAVLDYAYFNLKDDSGLGIAICDGSASEIAAAKAAGFLKAKQTETVLRLDLDRAFSAPLPAGLRFTSPDPVQDACALQWLFWQGFDHGTDRAAFEREETVVPRLRKHFDRDLCVAAADETGDLAALCGLWYDKKTDYAYVEPVCTVPAWRGKGAAKAVIFEALTRAAARGARKAYVISDMEFYRKLGFVHDRKFTFYWKT